MSGARSRNKGSAGERELARLLSDELGVEVVRRLGQARDGGHDLDGLPGWCLEVKRRAKVSEADKRRWWGQAVGAAEVQALEMRVLDGWFARPAVLYRADRGKWRAIVELSAINGDFAHAPCDYENTAEISLLSFCQLVRESLPVESRKAG